MNEMKIKTNSFKKPLKNNENQMKRKVILSLKSQKWKNELFSLRKKQNVDILRQKNSFWTPKIT
jgi:hypothetical protein